MTMIKDIIRKLFITSLLSFSIVFHSLGQSIYDKEWVKFHVDRLDGSSYVERNNLLTTQIRYTFRQNGEVEIWGYGEGKHRYSLNDSILVINPFIVYRIEEMTDSLLILVDITNKQLDKDRITRFYFTTEEKYMDNVLSRGLVRILDDSIIISNIYLKPICHYDLEKYLYNSLSSELPKDINFSGYFIISPFRIVTKVSLNDRENSMSNFESKFIKLINETTFRWNLPDNSRGFYYLINFSVKAKGTFIDFSFFEQDSAIKFSELNYEEKEQANLLFQKGNNLLKRKKYEIAIQYYTECLKIDNIFIDAYYNRAYAFHMIGRNSDACLDWKYLHDLGQTNGIIKYIEHCKE